MDADVSDDLAFDEEGVLGVALEEEAMGGQLQGHIYDLHVPVWEEGYSRWTSTGLYFSRTS